MASRLHNPIVMIPARMASTRLPGKPLADIGGEPMIVHVWRRATQAGVGPVVVAGAEPEVLEPILAAGGTAILTRPDHRSGSDRVFEALTSMDPNEQHDIVVNVQGDLPTIDPALIGSVLLPLSDPNVDIGTLVAPIADQAERSDPNVVKVALSLRDEHRSGRALYFSRAEIPWGDGPFYHHIGLYAYRRSALARFVAMAPGVLEERERLEQLRALENGMRIDAAVVDTVVPLGVDTQADLETARAILAANAQ